MKRLLDGFVRMEKIKGIKSLFDEHQAKITQLKALVKAGAVNQDEYETFVRESNALYEKEKGKLLHEALAISPKPIILAPVEDKHKSSPLSSAAKAPNAGSASDHPISMGGGDEGNIVMVMQQAECSREKAIEALSIHKNNAVNAIMSLMM